MGASVGNTVGIYVGVTVGVTVGTSVGNSVGMAEGVSVGLSVGKNISVAGQNCWLLVILCGLACSPLVIASQKHNSRMVDRKVSCWAKQEKSSVLLEQEPCHHQLLLEHPRHFEVPG